MSARSYTRRKLMMDTAIIKPPRGYEWVEYIENTSTAYIDTNFVFRSASMTLNAMEIDMEIMELPSSSAVGIFGSRHRATDVDATFIEILTDGRYHTTIRSTNYYTQASTGKHIYSIVSDKLYIDGVRFGDRDYPRHSIGTVGIFAIREAALGNFSTFGLKARLYRASFEAYDQKKIFLPILRLRDNKYGLWDAVSNSFYVSPNNINFTGGNIINRYTI